MTTWTREMAVELAREEYERGLAEGRAAAAAEIERLQSELAVLKAPVPDPPPIVIDPDLIEWYGQPRHRK